MTNVPSAVIVNQLTRVLREAFEGPPGPWSYFTDKSPGAGVFGTIGRLSAAEASRHVGPGGSTIAGHVEHLCSSLLISTRWIRGQLTTAERARTWTVRAVDDAGWADLQARLRREYDALTVTVLTQAVWDEEALGGAIGAIAHTAYHLGAIRQRLAAKDTG